MFEEKLEEANATLDQAVAILLKEQSVNFEMAANDLPIDHENSLELLHDLQEIKIKITELQIRFKDLAVS